jgi:hypothetical protein
MEPIGVYRTHEGTGWAAYAKSGLAWRVSEDEARAIMGGK